MMASELNINTTDFETKVLQSDVPVLVDFWAEWCGPCKMIGPAIEELSTEFAGKAKVFKVDVDSEGTLAERYGIMSIPQLLVFKGGKEVDRMVGAAPKPQIAELLKKQI
jgi:thioredoxin 1